MLKMKGLKRKRVRGGRREVTFLDLNAWRRKDRCRAGEQHWAQSHERAEGI